MLNQTAYVPVTHSVHFMIEPIKTRFGEVSVDTNKSITFPMGLLGMPDKFNFNVTAFPNPKMRQFTLLQSLDDHALSFITLPLDMQNGIISASDLKSACRELQLNETNVAALLIVSVHRTPEGISLSVNARAPLLIDSVQRIGAQYVFPGEHYSLQHML